MAGDCAASKFRVIPLELKSLLREEFRLDWWGIHGAPHWARVLHHGRVLAKHVGADVRVVTLFALLHDICREDDGQDPLHGHRAADLVRSLQRKGRLGLTDPQARCLAEACEGHSEGMTQASLTVQVCWDADRLDLGRLGIRPDPLRLCTNAARDPARIDRAWMWSTAQNRYGRRPCAGQTTVPSRA